VLLTKKEGGNVLSRDLIDVLKAPIVSAADFVYSTHLTTYIAIIPKSSVDTWKTKYETWSQFVVPGSTKQF